MKNTLATTNPYLRDRAKRGAALRVSAESSSAVEGIRKPFSSIKPARTVTRPARKGAKFAG